MPNPTQTAALATLIILQVIMLFSLYFQIPPHPPTVIPFGGMGPFLGASLSLAVAALILQGQGVAGRLAIVLACLCAAVSFGPQKYFDPAFALVWPAVCLAQLAILALLLPLLTTWGRSRHAQPAG